VLPASNHSDYVILQQEVKPEVGVHSLYTIKPKTSKLQSHFEKLTGLKESKKAAAANIYQVFIPGIYTRYLYQVFIPGIYTRYLYHVFIYAVYMNHIL